MKTNKQLVLLAAPVILLSNLGQADLKLGNYDLASSVDLGGQYSSLGHRSSKFDEYRDIRSSVLAGAKLSTEKDEYHMDLSANRIGLDDQNYRLNGGKYGKLKYDLYFNSIIHNYTFNAISFYSGIGTGSLSYGQTLAAKDPTSYTVLYEPLLTDTSLWNTFDYKIKSKNYGVEASYLTDSPFYFRWGVTQQKTDGVRPMSASSVINADFATATAYQKAAKGSLISQATTTSTTGSFVQIPEPVDYKTNTFSINSGYKGENFLASVDGTLTKFSNGITSVDFQIPTVTTEVETQTMSLAPDNTNWKLGAQGTYFHLPLGSTLATRASYSKATNSVDLISGRINSYENGGLGSRPVYFAQPDQPSLTNFQGSNAQGALSVALSSNPVENLDTKVYYNFLRNWNNSPQLYYTQAPVIGTPSSVAPTLSDITGRFGYIKHNYGLDAGYRLPLKTRIGAGYDFQSINRSVDSFVPNTSASLPMYSYSSEGSLVQHASSDNDYTGYLEVKNSYLDFLSGRIRAQHMIRKGTFFDPYQLTNNVQDNTGNKLWEYQFIRPFYVASKNEDTFKASLDFLPTDDLDINLDGSFKTGKYTDTQIGRLSDNSYETYLGVTYDLPKLFKTTVFGGYQIARNTTQNRIIGTGESYDPGAAPSQTAFNWTQLETTQTYEYGANVDVPVGEKLSLTFGAQKQRNTGSLQFATQVLPLAGPYSNINNLDNYTRNTATAKAKYQFRKNLAGTLGYMFESLQYDDFQSANYANVQAETSGAAANYYGTANSANAGVKAAAFTAANINNFSTGAYTDQNYTAHTVFVTADYTF